MRKKIFVSIALVGCSWAAVHAQNASTTTLKSPEERKAQLSAHPVNSSKIVQASDAPLKRQQVAPSVVPVESGKDVTTRTTTIEERDALILRYEMLIAENAGKEGFNRSDYENRIAALRAKTF